MPQDKGLLQKRVLRRCSVAPLHVTGVSSGFFRHGVPSPPPSSEPRAMGQIMSGPDGIHLAGEPGYVGRCGWSWVLRCKWRPNSGWGRGGDLLEGTAWLELLGEEPGVCFLSTVQHLPDHDATSSSQSTCSVQGLPSGCSWPWQGPRTPALQAQLPGYLGLGVSPPRCLPGL